MKKIIILFTLFLIITIGCTNKKTIEVINYNYILKSSEDYYAKVNEFTIYGKYFNLNGELDLIDYTNITLVLKNSEVELEYPLIMENKEKNIYFKTNKYINEGINLEKIEKDYYVVLLKIVSNGNIKYINLLNNSNYQDVDYYTITKNNQNDYIKIDFSNEYDKDYMRLLFFENINDNICDIVIDPGHGGIDSGATNGKYYEKTYNLDYAKTLKEVLEDKGLKVKLTRDSDYLPDSYGNGSRTGIPYECSAKLMLSLHLNSDNKRQKNASCEVYIANGDNTTFAKILVDNIVSKTNKIYSSNNDFKVIDGVYLRKYSNSDLKSIAKDAKKDGWTMYENANTNTTYYYFIRETGGIITKAITDGRNPRYKANPYYLSNHGTETYLVELGYISDANNLKEIINNKENYIKALVESIEYYINN